MIKRCKKCNKRVPEKKEVPTPSLNLPQDLQRAINEVLRVHMNLDDWGVNSVSIERDHLSQRDRINITLTR